jgi:hypothetical protein
MDDEPSGKSAGKGIFPLAGEIGLGNAGSIGRGGKAGGGERGRTHDASLFGFEIRIT